jgi:drug/metabolite transporter (DMT)-like permease
MNENKKQLIYKMLHYLSKLSSYVVVLCGLFILQNYLYKLIPISDIVLYDTFYLNEVLATIISIIITKKFFTFSSPYAEKIK